MTGWCISARTATSLLFIGKEDGGAQSGLGLVLELGWTYLQEKAHGLCCSPSFFFLFLSSLAAVLLFLMLM
jgi:hypothetical protein